MLILSFTLIYTEETVGRGPGEQKRRDGSVEEEEEEEEELVSVSSEDETSTEWYFSNVTTSV
jgi:hypothetical protein